MATRKAPQQSAKRTAAVKKGSKGFTDAEKAAMKERVDELKAEARQADGKVPY